jgi:hypothetical protein
MNDLKQQPFINSVLEVLQAETSYTNTLKQISVEVVLSRAMS